MITFLHNFAGPYFLSDFGKLCETPIINLKECKNAANHFKAVYIQHAIGNGYDLPFGCIFDQIELGKTFVYWNPDGRVDGSIDLRIQQLCILKEETVRKEHKKYLQI